MTQVVKAVSPVSEPKCASKYDSGKPRLDLLDDDFMEAVAHVMGFGAQKYAANNWRKGIEYSRLIAALRRHVAAFAKGDNIDDESGLEHLAHAGCCLMFLHWMSRNRGDLDDRWRPEES